MPMTRAFSCMCHVSRELSCRSGLKELRGAKQERDEALHKINEMQGSGTALSSY